MIHIGKSYIQRIGGTSRLCVDIHIGDRERTLWFAVDSSMEEFLGVGRADPFVMVMLIPAVSYRRDIVCDDAMSERLHYQLCSGLIPAIASAGGGRLYHEISIAAPLTRESIPNRGAVGTGFSGGLDSLYTIMTHGKDCEYPLTHIAVDNAVSFDKYGREGAEVFRENCRAAEKFAREQGLETVFVDTNFREALAQNYTNAYDEYRHIACALALSKLYKMYLISSFHSAGEFCLDLDMCGTHDSLIADCASTESLRFYSAGSECKRLEKLVAISDWEPSYRWLHACFTKRPAGERNCGMCKKCKEVQIALHALGKLDRYRAVFDVDAFERDYPRHLAYILANQDDPRAQQVLRIVHDSGVPIPPEALRYQRQFQRAIRDFKQKHEGASK